MWSVLPGVAVHRRLQPCSEDRLGGRYRDQLGEGVSAKLVVSLSTVSMCHRVCYAIHLYGKFLKSCVKCFGKYWIYWPNCVSKVGVFVSWFIVSSTLGMAILSWCDSLFKYFVVFYGWMFFAISVFLSKCFFKLFFQFFIVEYFFFFQRRPIYSDTISIVGAVIQRWYRWEELDWSRNVFVVWS